jgi:hypothetical protein
MYCSGPSDQACGGYPITHKGINGPCEYYRQGYGCQCPNSIRFATDPNDRSWMGMNLHDYVQFSYEQQRLYGDPKAGSYD